MQDFGNRNQMSIEVRAQAESVVQRVFLAVQSLCVGKGDVRNRLLAAIKILLPLQSHEFPKFLKEDFEWIIKQSTKYKSPYPERYGQLEATMKRIKNATGSKIAEKIFDLYSEIQKIRGFPLLEYRNPNE